MNDFDSKAAEWDKNPIHWERSAVIVEEIKKRITFSPDLTAMEYGAGTGIASFLLKDDFRSILMLDNSDEMVRVTLDKIKASGSKNLAVEKFDLEHQDYRSAKFDLIFSQMVFHHIADIDAILKRIGGMLNPGGSIAVADLYNEDGSFHGDGFTGHNGFNPSDLAKTLSSLGFRDIVYEHCYTVSRKISETETRNYPLFLITAVKK
jgi:tRNA (cmo5U34)-methyltransferase